MRFAKSLLYGGALVDAWKADYKDYARLLLRCRHCGEGVHLIGGCYRPEHARLAPKSKKIVLVKEADIKPAFAHFHDTGHECIAKSKSFVENEQDVQRSIVAGRNQRLKTFQRRFWSIVSRDTTGKYAGKTFEAALCMSNNTKYLDDFKLLDDEMRLGFANCFVLQKDFLKDYSKTVIQKVLNDPTHMIVGSDEDVQEQIRWLSMFEQDIHHAIVCEAIDYLTIKSSRHVLAQFFDFAFGLIWVSALHNNKEKKFLDNFVITSDFSGFKANFSEITSKATYGAVLFLVGIDWGSALANAQITNGDTA